tara:strand:+ start:879 stop:1112 length:234 start_codon:yes stop_codon:yes gene_type:complete
MNNEQVLAIVDAIKDIGYTLRHTLGDSETGKNDGNVGNIMFSMDRIADAMDGIQRIEDRLTQIEEAVSTVAHNIDCK